MLTLTRADLDRWGRLYPARGMTDSPLKRIIWHWSGGRHIPNSTDLAAYHFLFPGTGDKVVRGSNPLNSNLRKPLTGRNYAAHTGSFNSGSAGLAVCGMRGEKISADKFGDWPITLDQLHEMLAFSAALASEHKLQASNRDHAFTHREAWELHGVRGKQNHQKNDFVVLPPVPGVEGWKDCGNWMRGVAGTYQTQIQLLLSASGQPLPPRELPKVTPFRGWVRTRGALRVRPDPSTRREAIAVLPGNTLVLLVGKTGDGESVQGNRVWLQRLDGGWIWSGGTDL